MRRSSFPFFLVGLVGLVAIAGCDPLIDKLRESVDESGPPEAGNGPMAPGTGGATTPPVPPPDASEPGPAKQLCASTAACTDGRTCSTEWGACLSPPGCGGETACPAVCYGTCEAGPPECTTDADCRTHADYCTGCDCRAFAKGEAEPVCSNPVQCLVDPCQNKVAACAGGTCVIKDPGVTPPKCAETAIVGDESTCKSEAEWKQVAHEACVAQGLELTYYGIGGGDCGQGRTHQVKYDCCAPAVSAPSENF